MRNLDWEDVWGIFALICCVIVVIFITLAVIADKPVRFYYLTGDIKNGLIIKGDVDWDIDQELALDRAITYPEAIQMIKELNSTLHVK